MALVTTFRIIYLILFCSIDVLVYLTVGRNNPKVKNWLIGAGAVWLIVLVFHLPVFHNGGLMSLKAYLTLSAYVILMLAIHYLGRLGARIVESRPVPGEVKEQALWRIALMFDRIPLGFFLLVHLIGVLSAVPICQSC